MIRRGKKRKANYKITEKDEKRSISMLDNHTTKKLSTDQHKTHDDRYIHKEQIYTKKKRKKKMKGRRKE